MKYLKIIIKILFIIITILLFLLLIDYIRLNISYNFNKKNYTEVFDVQGNTLKYTPQGLSYSEKYNVVLQTSYNSKHFVSMLFVIDFKTGKTLKKLKLKEIDNSDNINHVGGITTYNDKVYITNNYEINEYNLKEILTTDKDYIKAINNTKLLNRGDFCTYNNNILWIGDFFLNPFYKVPDNNPLLMGYKIDKEIDYNKPDYIISLPKMVQGMVITEDNKFIFTRSFTNLIKSDLSIYNNVLNEKNEYYNLNDNKVPYYKFNKNNLIKSYKLPPMAEELFYKDDEIYILFENSSDTYFYAYPKLNKIIKIDINKIDN